MAKTNKSIAQKFLQLAKMLEMSPGRKKPGHNFRIQAYKKAADSLQKTQKDIQEVYKQEGKKGLQKIDHIGKGMSQKIEQYLKRGKIKELKELKEKTTIQQIITHFFKTKGLSLDELKKNAKKRKIVYSRYTRPAKQLLELAGSVSKAKEAINTVAKWANSRDLDYAIETVFKKWLELDRLEPKEVVKKPFYQGKPMVWSQTKKKWFVIDPQGEWLEFVGKKKDIEWREKK